MNWNNVLLQVLDFGSFSSIWYWIVVAVTWSTVSHWVIGVPYDMVQRAKRHGGEATQDLIDVTRINVNRQLTIASMAGTWIIGFLFFLVSSLAVLGFWYKVELAQAVFLLVLPMTIVGAITLSTSRLIAATEPDSETIIKQLTRHRLWTQIIGMLSIFFTAMYGMFQNLSVLQSF